MRGRTVLFVGAAVLATALPAAALLGPVPVFDFSAVEQIVKTFHQTEQVVANAKALVTNAETNLRSLDPRNFGNLRAQVSSLPAQGQGILTQAQMAEAQFRGVAVADAITSSAPGTAAQAQAINAQAQSSVGAHSDAQVGNEIAAQTRDATILGVNLAASEAKGAFIGNVQGAQALSTLEGDPQWTP